MKKSKPYENQIKQAVIEAFGVKQALLQKEADAHPLSPDVEARIFDRVRQALLASQAKRRRISLRIALVAAILAITMLFCGTAVMACPSLRDRVVHFFTKEDDRGGNTHYTAVVEGAESKVFRLSAYYTLNEIPDGFISIISREEPASVLRKWLKSDSSLGIYTVISFSQIPVNESYVLRTEGHTAVPVTVHDREATLYTAPNSQKLVWHTEECMFVVSFLGSDTNGLDALALANSLVRSR
jgi:hypothetical protein